MDRNIKVFWAKANCDLQKFLSNASFRHLLTSPQCQKVVSLMFNTDLFEATIRFNEGTAAKVTARVLRWETEYAILRFSDHLSCSVIAAEQRRLYRASLAPVLFTRKTSGAAGGAEAVIPSNAFATKRYDWLQRKNSGQH